MKFRGQISQGLVQPLSILSEGTYKIGDEVTELLGIRKWEVEERVTSSGTIIGEFPDGIPKTDELRVQSYPELIDEFKKINGYYISTKMDGTSVTMYRKDDHFGVCGRNFEYADDGKCAMWKYAHENGIPDRIKENNLSDLAIQGEFCGAGIQKNRLKLKKPCGILNLKMVPVEEERDLFEYDSIEELLERAKGKYTSGMNKEGIVIRPLEPVYSRIVEGPLSMKVLNNDYLLKE